MNTNFKRKTMEKERGGGERERKRERTDSHQVTSSDLGLSQNLEGCCQNLTRTER